MERTHRLASFPAVRLPRVAGPVLAALVALAVVLGGGWLWLRDSSLVQVRSVEIIGLSSSEAGAVRRALSTAALDMTTLHVRRADLEAAIKPYPSVAGLRVQADFPHGLSIEVTERAPIAEVDLAGDVVPVGAGGRLMRNVEPTHRLPVLHATRLAPGGRLTDPRALAAVGVLAAAPAVLRRKVARIWTGPKGLTMELRSGPQLFFGAAGRARAKWLATARVLAEPAAAGSVYLDVRVPERVAAGGLGSQPEEDSADPQPQPEITPSLNP